VRGRDGQVGEEKRFFFMVWWGRKKKKGQPQYQTDEFDV
jgi:hypothetical protein